MQLYHDSQNKIYRNPQGAVPTGEKVTISIEVTDKKAPVSVVLRLFQKDQEHRLPMKKVRNGDGRFLYQVGFDVGVETGLLWYDFIAEGHDQTLYYTNSADKLGGVGETKEAIDSNSYQITVYDKNYRVPHWFCDQIMYQIFPDRFYGYHEGAIQKKREEYIIHDNWYAPISFNRHPYEDGPACNDFYGGNLKGIEKKLPYLKELGVSVIYLNPIFDAYSNHKYDTADYKKIDPMFGTEQDFKDLCAAAKEQGISIILDGVFSHTGADSIYFNKYGSYGAQTGAYRDSQSPYKNWYQFTDYPQYESWWGCNNLPNVNEMEDSYLDYILRDSDAVIKKWIRCGAKGWRLDVADELPDEFIEILRREVKKENEDAVIIGEVWEDASHKIAYGKMRQYLMGNELDSVMNYPFKDRVLAFLMGWEDAAFLHRHIMAQIENYPTQTLYALMNMLGTHDTMRVKSMLGGMSRDCGDSHLTSKAEDIAVKRLKMAFMMQMTFYGVPCIYYGDEVGMQGGKDPFNRGTYPWRAVDIELLDWVKKLTAIRKNTDCLRRGRFETVFAEGGVYGYLRYFEGECDVFGSPADGTAALCLINRDGTEKEIALSLPKLKNAVFYDAFSMERKILGETKETFVIPPYTAQLWIKGKSGGRNNVDR